MSALRGLRILVVENDEMNATLLELQLAQAGADVVGIAASVKQALALIDSERPDRAVLDFRLAAGETSETVARVLTERATPYVLATGVAAASLPAGFATGVVLTKPYLSEQLIKALEDAHTKMTARP
ncbi:response regulator [Xanthomonas albilineans]|uniref:Putative two-component system response regulator protein n=1 Tax=Xanthomonas albilineans (strain GPE PC73 / CFBP 7063) TaxID=380358 RepID=D2UAT9_XANAP|nr:response regulator [Xanthomonas albilineans]PPU94709.1 response regulator [Xanthomonas albilineans]QHQ28363.1 putative two-component system response regulator protein [Xanthomonas albilineans]CBA16132.1 putative two-component system response regulator protein [Xanthomonas albilineans GPE PC73]